jgi:hypothetical protein
MQVRLGTPGLMAPQASITAVDLSSGENMKELTERGLQLFSEIRSSERAASMLQLIEDNAFGCALANVAVDSVFASIWTREGLERKQRNLVTGQC